MVVGDAATIGTPWCNAGSVDWSSYASAETVRFSSIIVNERRPPVIGTWELYMEMQKTMDITGREALESYEAALSELCEKFPLGPMQIEFEYNVRIGLLSIFFNKDMAKYRKYLYEDRGFPMYEKHYQSLALLYPRQMGKTTIESIMTAVIAVSQRKGNILSFHLTARQAKSWLDRVREFLAMFKDSARFGWRVDKQDVREYIHIYANEPRVINKIIALPGSSDGTGNIRIHHLPPSSTCSFSLSFSFSLSLSLSLLDVGCRRMQTGRKPRRRKVRTGNWDIVYF
jgi:hypothetical protein